MPAVGNRRFDAGSLLRGLGAFLGLVALFLPWYEPGASAWTAFETADAVLFLLAVAVLHEVAHELGVVRRATGRPAWPFAVAFLAFTALQLINRPPSALDSGLEVGAWMALVAGVLMALGVLLSRMQVTVSVDAASPVPAPRRNEPDETRATELAR